MDSIEALASAIAAVRLERPDLSVKQVHAELCKQPAWQEVTVSDVKKVSSKMAKQATRSGSSVAASSTLEPPATAESAAPPRRREKGLRMRQQCATCATVADAGGRYGMRAVCPGGSAVASALLLGSVPASSVEVTQTVACMRPSHPRRSQA